MTAVEQSAVLFVFQEIVWRFESLQNADSNHYSHQFCCSCVSLLCERAWPTVSPGQIDEGLKDELSLSVSGRLWWADKERRPSIGSKEKMEVTIFRSWLFHQYRVDIFRIAWDVFCNNFITFHLIVCLQDV